MKGGNITFYFKGDDSDLDKKSSGISSKMGGIAKSVGSAFVKGTAVAGTALIGLIGKSVSMAGDLEQQLGGTEAVFGQFASQVQAKSKEAFSTMGLSANDYMATINKMGALMQGSGLDIETSMDLSSQAMQRASDVASIMGIDIDMAMESIAGAAKGNFTMMDNLGVAMNATTIEAYALSKGINKSYNEMTKAEQVQYAMQMFLEKSSYAMGNYSKENETFAGSLQTLKASFGNFMSGAGSIDDVINSVVSFGNILVKSITEMAPKITTGLVQLLNGIIPQIPILLQSLLPSVVTGVISLIQGIINMLPTIITMLAGMLPTIITALINGLVTIIQTLAQMLPELMPTIIDAILGIIPILIDNLPLFIKAGWQLITGLLEGLIRSVPTLLSYIPKIISSLFNYFKQMPKMALDIGINLVKGIWNGISNVTGWVLGKIKGFGKSILNGIKGIFGIHSPSTEFAWVGKMNAEGLIEGMDGMEKEVQQSFDGMFDLSPQLYGTSSTNMSPNVNVVVNSNYEQDPLGQMVSKVKTFSGGSKNDYNYGYGGV
jgi:phage-related protein